jgi:putative ABC transport system substrate-binding protein
VARAAQRATTTIPIVVVDATADGPEPLVASLARPGGNITGLGNLPMEFSSKALEVLHAAVPGVARVAVLTDPFTLPERAERWVRTMEAAAQTLGLTLTWTHVQHVDQVADALDAAVRHQPDALMLDATRLFPACRQVAAFALQHRLPTVTWWRELVEEGALMAYNVDNRESFRRVATYVDKLLKGATPADLPIERPMKFSLIINLKTAEALGITIPATLLFQADEVIR